MNFLCALEPGFFFILDFSLMKLIQFFFFGFGLLEFSDSFQVYCAMAVDIYCCSLPLFLTSLLLLLIFCSFIQHLQSEVIEVLFSMSLQAHV